MIIIYPGRIVTKGYGNSMMYLDQLTTTSKWIYSRSFSKYIKSTYNITLEEYYKLIIEGNPYHKYYCRCGNELHLKNPNSLHKGFPVTCGDSRCIKESILESQSITYETRLTKDYYIELCHNNSIRVKSLWDKGIYDSDITINSFESNIYKCYSNLRSMYRSIDKLYLYFMEFDTEFKFGVTGNLDSRLHTLRPLNVIILYYNYRDIISELELWIKIKLLTSKETLPKSKFEEFNSILKTIMDEYFIHDYRLPELKYMRY